MQTLIIYDNDGHVISIIGGNSSAYEPVGVPFIWVDIPSGKQLKITDGIGVDVSVAPHQAILEDIPKTEVELLKEQVDALNIALAQVMGV